MKYKAGDVVRLGGIIDLITEANPNKMISNLNLFDEVVLRRRGEAISPGIYTVKYFDLDDKLRTVEFISNIYDAGDNRVLLSGAEKTEALRKFKISEMQETLNK